MRNWILRFVIACGCLAPAGYASAQCPKPAFSGSGPYWPGFADMNQRLSPNGKFLIAEQPDGGGISIIVLATLKRTWVHVNDSIPDAIPNGYDSPVFCPYDSDLIAVTHGIILNDNLYDNLFIY